MKTYHFELVLDAPPSEAEEERLYELFEGRVSSAIVNEVAVLYVHIDSLSLDDAVRNSVDKTRSLGLRVSRVELDPDKMAADAA